MGKSFRRNAEYNTGSVNPAFGKKLTSHQIRRAQKEQERVAADLTLDHDFYIDDIRDSSRGTAGSKSPDSGWDNFGDGRKIHSFDKNSRK